MGSEPDLLRLVDGAQPEKDGGGGKRLAGSTSNLSTLAMDGARLGLVARRNGGGEGRVLGSRARPGFIARRNGGGEGYLLGSLERYP